MRTFSLSLIFTVVCAAYMVHGLPVAADGLAIRNIPSRAGFLITDPTSDTTGLKEGSEDFSKVSRGHDEDKRSIPSRAGFLITDPTSDTTDLKKDDKLEDVN